jgi:hypothetical protein
LLVPERFVAEPLRPAWRGMGLTDQSVDAIGDLTTYDSQPQRAADDHD